MLVFSNTKDSVLSFNSEKSSVSSYIPLYSTLDMLQVTRFHILYFPNFFVLSYVPQKDHINKATLWGDKIGGKENKLYACIK